MSDSKIFLHRKKMYANYFKKLTFRSTDLTLFVGFRLQLPSYQITSSKQYGMSEVLLLGMVYSNETEPKRGQEYRDRVRCEALETLGYSVKTLDNKHKDDTLTNGKHCTANFADARRMLKSMNTRWEKITFEHIILDYFFSPVSNKFYYYFITL